MSLRIRFLTSVATDLVLAKVGNPQREEPLETSRQALHIKEDDREILTALFLKPFKSLSGNRFQHHSSLAQHELNICSTSIFTDPSVLWEKGCQIAQRLYAKSVHPNIKSGDLCISLIDQVEVDGEFTQALCILKSESVTPFLSIVSKDGDLALTTEHGINPEKIDKGCLIINHLADKGYYVLMFDRAGAESRFWVKDFLGVAPFLDDAFLTTQYTQLAADFLEKESLATSTPEVACTEAQKAINYFEEQEEFELEDFEKRVLKDPGMVARFAEQRHVMEEEQGVTLPPKFAISQKDVTKAKKKINTVLKLDTGVEIHLKHNPDAANASIIERGFDEDKHMKYIKVFYHRDISEDG